MRTTTNNVKKLFAGFCLLAVCLFSSCEIGLGPRLNTEKPVISIPEESRPGSFIDNDNNTIYVDVEQEFGVQDVWFDYWYTDLEGNKQNGRVKAYWSEEQGRWAVDIDTSKMADGEFRAQVTAVDVSGNSTTSTELLYTVKNNPPLIWLTQPRVRGDQFDDPNLNISRLFGEPLRVSDDIVGAATDISGIDAGYPQIMIWPAGYEGPIDEDDAEMPVRYDRPWGRWRTLVDDNWQPVNQIGGEETISFRWPMVAKFREDGGNYRLPVEGKEHIEWLNGEYRFKIRVRSGEVLNVYPNRLRNIHGYTEAYASANPNPNPIQFMQIAVRSTEEPVVRFPIPRPPLFYSGSRNARHFSNPENHQNPYEAYVTATTVSAIASLEVLLEDVLLGTWEGESTDLIERVEGTNHHGTYKITIPWPLPNSFLNSLTTDEQNRLTRDGLKTLTVLAFDVSDSEGTAGWSFTLDTQDPTMSYTNPARMPNAKNSTGVYTPAPTRVTSTLNIRGGANDDDRVQEMYFALGRDAVSAAGVNPEAAEWINTNFGTENAMAEGWSGGITMWQWQFPNISDLVTGSDNSNVSRYTDPSDPSAGNLWLLPISFMLKDRAGNISFHNTAVVIDPDSDIPAVTISSHTERTTATTGSTVGGVVRVNGLATDNENIHSVEYRVVAQGNSALGPAATLPSFSAVDNGRGGVNWRVTGTANDGWVSVDRAGSAEWDNTANWFFRINQDGLLNPPTGEKRIARVEVRAKDSAPGVDVNVPRHTVTTWAYMTFDTSVPDISNITILTGNNVDSPASTRPYDPWAPISGSATMRATVKDDSGIATIEVSFNGGTTLEDIIAPGYNNAGGTKPWARPVGTPQNGRYTEYTVFIPLDSNSLSSAFRDKTGTYDLVVQVTDNTEPNPFMTVQRLSQPVDNFYPMSTFTGRVMAVSEADPSTWYTVSGRAWDTSSGVSIQNVARVVVYLSRNNTLISYTTGANASTADRVTNQAVRSNRRGTETAITSEGTNATLSYFPRLSQDAEGRYLSNAFGIVIDRSGYDDFRHAANGNEGNFQRFDERAGGKNWLTTIDTRNLSDGPVRVNTVIFDHVGNASHYYQDVYIANNRPRIGSISIGADISGDGNITDTPNEYRVYPSAENPIYAQFNNGRELETGFGVRGRMLEFRINNVTPATYDPKRFVVTHVTQGTVGDLRTIVKGNVYTIENVGTNVEWLDYGVFGVPMQGTTFVATNAYADIPNNTNFTGTVRSYNTVGTASLTERTGQLGTRILFPSASFDETNGIRESATTQTSPGVVMKNQDRLFIVKVYNTVPLAPTTDRKDQLAHAVLVRMAIDNTDNIRPLGRIYDFNPMAEASVSRAHPGIASTPDGLEYSTNSIQGGLYFTGGTAANAYKDGHIEPRSTVVGVNNRRSHFFTESSDVNAVQLAADGIFTRDVVSGRVILRGYAHDNHSLDSISLSIGGSTVEVARRQDGVLVAANSSSYVGRNTVEFEGHTVEWAYVWNTETIPANTVAGSNIEIRLIVSDTGGATISGPAGTKNQNFDYYHPSLTALPAGSSAVGTNNGSGRYTGTDQGYNRISVDIAPYIRALRRANANTFRSKYGWYAFRRSEAMEITGFNLSAYTGTTTVSIGGTNVPVTVNTANRGILTIGSLPDTVNGGSLILTTGGITAVNGRNVNSRYWNNETSVYHPGSEYWLDDRSVYIWQSNDAAGTQGSSYTGATEAAHRETGHNNAHMTTIVNAGYFARSENSEFQSMSIDPENGVLYGAFSNRQRGDQLTYWTTNSQSEAGTVTVTDVQNYTSANGATQINARRGNQTVRPRPGFISRSQISHEYTDIHLGYTRIRNAAAAQNRNFHVPTVTFIMNGFNPWYNNGTAPEYEWKEMNSGFILTRDVIAGAVGFYAGGYAATGDANRYNGDVHAVEGQYTDRLMHQFESPRLVTNDISQYVSYYDSDTKSIKYWYNTVGTTFSGAEYEGGDTSATTTGSFSKNLANVSPATPIRAHRWINIDGGYDGHDLWAVNRVVGSSAAAETGGGVFYRNDRGRSTSAAQLRRNAAMDNFTGSRDSGAGIGATSAAGKYHAIDIARTNEASEANNGFPVIVYYDESNHTLRLAYSTTARGIPSTGQVNNGNVAGVWRRQNVMGSGDPNYNFSGRDISMKIHRPAAGGTQEFIHIVFRRFTTNDLIYIRGSRNSLTSDYTFSPSVIIDDISTVGMKADLSLDSVGNPYISYLDYPNLNTNNGLKMAFYNPSFVTADYTARDRNGVLSTGWEYMQVPVDFTVNEGRTNIENWPTFCNPGQTGGPFWSAAIGYGSDRFRIAYFVKP